MSRPMADTPKRRPRRQFTDEFKAGAVRLVLDEGKTVGAAARDLDLTETALREWVKRASADRTQGPHRPDDRRARGAGAAAQRESRAADGARHPKKSRGLLREAPAVRFAWIAAEKAELHGRRVLSGAARVAAAASTPGSSVRSRRMPDAIASCACWSARRIDASQRRYGSPRVHEGSARAAGERVSRKRVVRLMQEDGLQARARKRFNCTTMSDHDQPVAANLLDRQFTADAAESALGRRHDGVRHRRAAASCISRRSSICTRASSSAGPSAR